MTCLPAARLWVHLVPVNTTCCGTLVGLDLKLRRGDLFVFPHHRARGFLVSRARTHHLAPPCVEAPRVVRALACSISSRLSVIGASRFGSEAQLPIFLELASTL